ncbi:DUF2846 domain-containing protein [Betaproteobacteria bacterium LSUCC0115]|nr:DUF2846 domain-containing protein [Burkholderiales bacterium LSUCC0115]
MSRSIFSVNRLQFAGLLTVLLVLQGCATLPSRQVMQSETQGFVLPKTPESGRAMVYVVRPSGLGGLVRFNVYVDDQKPESEMGYTRGGQYIFFNVKPGTRKIQSLAENWSEWIIDVKAGEIVFIQQEPSIGLIMARNSIFKIDEIQGKYHVKTLQLGTILRMEK